MRLKVQLSILVLFTAFDVWDIVGQSKNVSYEKYIHQYKNVAIQEEKRHRIPASITLAQALLESNAGQSKLAQQANNHFGIKCHEWKGKSVYADDDKESECFRKYTHASESYKDHSKFLTERSHYAPLFKLKKNDYKGWAKGLQSCGYATDREYAQKLIRIIETYQLYRYQSGRRSKTNRTKEASSLYTTNKLNGVNYVTALSGDSFEKIAIEMGLSTKKLLKYNEAPSEDFPVQKGDIVYLEKKKRRADKSTPNHQVQSGESMYQISQRYGIRIRNLYKLNNKTPDYRPTVGDILKLR
jgi:LysM repeat protein